MEKGQNLAKVLYYYNLYEPSAKYKIICPFHADINASLLIDLQQGRYYCFGCNIHGEAIDFVRLANPQLNSLQQVQKYHQILKSDKTEQLVYNTTLFKKQQQDKKHELIRAQDYYFNLSQIDWIKEQSDIKDYMLQRGFDAKALNKVKAKLTYNDNYPIIFPLNDMGEFKGWICRTTNSEVEKKRKYLYNKGFSRSNTIVGKYNNQTVVLVEGFMDYLKMKQFGVNYVAAILGWKITSNQITKLKEHKVQYIISALDIDDCGEKGTEYLKKYFKVIRFQFPEGVKDPGDLDKQSFKIANRKTKVLYKKSKGDI